WCGSSRKRSCHWSERARCICDGAAPAVEFRFPCPHARRFRRSGGHGRWQRWLQSVVEGRTLTPRKESRTNLLRPTFRYLSCTALALSKSTRLNCSIGGTMNRRTLIGAATASVFLPLFNRMASAQTSPNTRNVVFVHGLFADGSC